MDPLTEVVRVRYLQPLDVDIDLATGRVVAVAPPHGVVLDLDKAPVCVDGRGDFLYPAPATASLASDAPVREQVLTHLDGAAVVVEIVPLEE